MIDRLSFDPVFPLLVIVVLMVIATAIFILFEWKKEIPKKLVRLIAVVVMMIGLTGILMRPHFSREANEGVILVTPGFDQSLLDSLHQAHSSYMIATLGASVRKSDVALDNENDIPGLPHPVRFIVGEGLSASGRELVDQSTFMFLPGDIAKGIIDVHIPQNVHVNQVSRITGLVNTDNDSVTIKLAGPSGPLDSVTLPSQGIQPFALSFQSRQYGNFVYTLSASTGDTHKIPVEISDKAKLNVLLLQRYPTFDLRSLKELLAKQHGVTARYELSKGIYRFENYNRRKEEFKKLTSGILAQFDVVVMDSEVIDQLSAGEWQTLLLAVKDGLGVVVLANTSITDQRRLKDLRFSFKALRGDTSLVTLNHKKQVLKTLPLTMTDGDGVDVILRSRDRVITASRGYGFGKIGVQLLQDTYQLVLQGDSLSYQTLWLSLIEKTSRQLSSENKLILPETFPLYPDEPLDFQLLSTAANPTATADSTRIPLIEDRIIDGLWTASVRFDKNGWHTIAGDSAQREVYVSSVGASSTIDRYNRIKATRRLSGDEKTNGTMKVREPVSPLLFLLMLVLGAAALWLIPKL